MKRETVILLHGLARSEKSMWKMARAMGKAGFYVINQGYDSRHHDVASLARHVLPQALHQVKPGHRVHFVTHSLGGILLRQYVKHHPIENLGRVVMLGPPNQGSQVVDKLKKMPGFYHLNGPAGMELGTDGVVTHLGRANFELGVIAGSRSINPILSMLLPGANDGKVTVASTRLKGMKAHLTLPVSHPFMMRSPQVIAQVIHFLLFGRFDK